MNEMEKVKQAEEVMQEIESKINLLNQMNLSGFEKAQVHQLSGRMIALAEKLNRIAYMNLFVVEDAAGESRDPMASYMSMFDQIKKNKNEK